MEKGRYHRKLVLLPIILGIIFVIIGVWGFVGKPSFVGVLAPDSNAQSYSTYTELDYTSFRQHLLNNEISNMTVYSDNRVTGQFIDGGRFNCTVPDYNQTIDDAVGLGVKVKLVRSWWSDPIYMFFIALGVGILVIVLISRFKQDYNYSGGKSYRSRSNSNGYGSITRGDNQSINKCERDGEGEDQVTFADIAGIDEIMVEIREIVDYIKNPKQYEKMGVTTPKGVLLAGPPGVGKTLIARAIANEAKANFIFSSASEFDERYVGVGASRIRSMFTKASGNRPSIIFIDEIDTIGYKRYQSINNSYEQTLNQLLTELDGFEKNTGVIVIAATNRIDVLDEALLRPGRFDRHIVINPPDMESRLKILEVHSRNKKLSSEARAGLGDIAAQTFGFSGADLANLLNEAGFHAIRRGKHQIEKHDLDNALERIIGGIARKSTANRREKKIIAYHEAGHAVAAYLLSPTNPVAKISIVSRGSALGYVTQLPKEDRYIVTEGEAKNRIKIMLAGRVAEELVYQEVSTGAQNDLEQANGWAKRMVCDFGMGQRLRNVTWNNVSIHQQIPELVTADIKQIIDECYKEVKETLKQNYTQLMIVSEQLLAKEVLTGEELEKIMMGKKIKLSKQIDRSVVNGLEVMINRIPLHDKRDR